MMPSKEPAGLDQALDAEMQDVEREPLEKGDEHMEEVEEEPLEKGEEEWRPGMRLSASHPSWMWKQNRKDLASRDGRNKAGKKIGKGTTSLNRAARRAAEQPRKNKDYWGSLAQQDSNPWQRDEGWWSNPWQRDRWEHSWERDDGWWEHFLEWEQSEREHSDPCEREERARSSGFRRRRRRSRRTRHSPTRSQSPCSDQRSEGSVTASPRSVASAGSGRSSSTLGKGKKLVWQKKEQDRQAWLQEKEKTGLADIPEEDDRPFSKMLEEMKKKEAEKEEAPPAPLEKGTEAAASTSPLEKGTEAAASTASPFSPVDTKTEPLEKGTEAAASTSPLEKGTPVDTKTEPLEKGAEAAASTSPLEKGTPASSAAPPLKKGKVMVDFYNVLFTGSTIPPGSLAAILLLQEAGWQPVICSFCGRDRSKEVQKTLDLYQTLRSLEVIFTNDRNGLRSKGSLCVEYGCKALFDDSMDILQGALDWDLPNQSTIPTALVVGKARRNCLWELEAGSGSLSGKTRYLGGNLEEIG